MSKTFKIILMFFSGLLSFVIFLWMSFPLDSLFRYFLANVETRTLGQFRVTAEDLKPSLLFDSTLTDVVVSQKSESGFEEIFTADELKIKVSWLSLLAKVLNVEFQADFASGQINGVIRSGGNRHQLELGLKNIQLDALQFIKTYLTSESFHFDAKGLVTGEIYAQFSPLKLKDAEAEFNLKVKDLVFDNIFVKALNPQPLTQLKLSTDENQALFQGSLLTNQLRVKELLLPGPDIDLLLKGKLNLKEEKGKVSLLRSDLKGRFAFSKTVLEALGDMLMLIESQKGSDGYFPLSVSGRAEKTSIRIGELDINSFLGL